jgi:3,4-dihydroxy 2-butanone 4-phosphate synthase / GTP cyclohydrolase II
MSDLRTTGRLKPRFPLHMSERRKARALVTSVSKARTPSCGSPTFLKSSTKGLREQDEDERDPMKQQLHVVKEHLRRTSPFARIEDAIAAIRAGKMVIVVDDEDRENEGDLTIAAEKITPEAINFMAQYGRGLICLSMTPERLDALDIPLMVSQNSSRFETAFCVSIEARDRTTTGISAADRAATVLAAIDPLTKPSDLVRPGHVFPLRARDAGVLARAGQTEAAVDLARLAGLHPSGVICEIMNKDGTMARVPQLSRFARRHNMPLITVADLITYRMRTESVVKCVASTKLPTEYGEFRLHAFENQIDKQTHVALVRGEVGDGQDVLVRVHSQCLTGDVLRSARCDCGAQLDKALRRIATEGRGVLLYLNQEGRGIGLANKIRAYRLQDEGLDTVEANERLGFKADQRDYGIGVQILRELGVRSMSLLSNNPRKLVAIEGYGLSVTKWLPLEIPASPWTLRYLTTKRNKLGHVLRGL